MNFAVYNPSYAIGPGQFAIGLVMIAADLATAQAVLAQTPMASCQIVDCSDYPVSPGSIYDSSGGTFHDFLGNALAKTVPPLR